MGFRYIISVLGVNDDIRWIPFHTESISNFIENPLFLNINTQELFKRYKIIFFNEIENSVGNQVVFRLSNIQLFVYNN